MLKNIAILGNGQLAEMMHDESSELGLNTTSFPLPSINKDGSCEQKEIDLWLQNLKDFDCVTFEIENIPVMLLKAVEQVLPVYPSIDALAVSQDRLNEKQLFNNLEIPTNEFLAVSSLADLKIAADKLGFPFVLKTRRFGYDGKGQFVLKQLNDIELAWSEIGSEYLIAEKFVNFDYEVSQVATRGKNGDILFYDLGRNEHRNGILRETYVLPHPNVEIVRKAKLVARKLLENFNYIGTIAVELFVISDDIYVNETAPRVHNSGHWTIDGADTSQFNNHLRAISGQDLGSVNMKTKHVMMINLIGEDASQDMFESSNVCVKSYNKEVRENRKIGHINITNHSKENFLVDIAEVYRKIKAKPCIEL